MADVWRMRGAGPAAVWGVTWQGLSQLFGFLPCAVTAAQTYLPKGSYKHSLSVDTEQKLLGCHCAPSTHHGVSPSRSRRPGPPWCTSTHGCIRVFSRHIDLSSARCIPACMIQRYALINALHRQLIMPYGYAALKPPTSAAPIESWRSAATQQRLLGRRSALWTSRSSTMAWTRISLHRWHAAAPTNRSAFFMWAIGADSKASTY